MGKVTNEAHGVTEKEVLPVCQFDPARGRIESGEKHVGLHHGGTSQFVEQRGFASVGVAYDGCGRDVVGLTLLPLGGSLLSNVLELGFETGDALSSETTINLDLLFPHPAGRSATAATGSTSAFAVEVTPHPGHPWQGVLHTGQIDLKPRFARTGTLGKDVENDLLPVDDRHVGQLFPVALLHRGDFIVKDETIAPAGAGQFNQFIGFPGPADKALVGVSHTHQLDPDNPDPESIDQLLKFSEEQAGFVLPRLVETKANQHGLLDQFRLFTNFEHQSKL